MQCPACENKDVFTLIETWKKYKIYHCRKCDVVFSHTMKNPGSEWYKKSEMYAVGKIIHTGVSWHHKQFLKDKKIYGQRLLDVGCGTGIFLNKAQEKGYDVWGIDFDSEDIDIARERYGLKNVHVISVGDISKDFSKDRFDIITFFEVLEHLDNPIQFMKHIKDILKLRGYIALSVPNRNRTLDTLGEGDYPPNHLTKWNMVSLTSFLEQNGFEVIKCIIKKFEADEIAGYLKSKIRFGIAKGLARQGIASNKKSDINKAATLMKTKDMTFKIITTPLIPILSILPLQGTGLYILARLKPVVTLSETKGNL